MDFKNLNLSQEMVKNLSNMGYKTTTPIQEKALPYTLDGKDIIAQAKTGSGKTATFGISILENLDVKKFRVQSLILCPTRELAQQVANELRQIAKFKHNIKILLLTGGESFGKQLGSLAHQAHIIVGTSGRVLKHLNKESLSLENLKTLVLDEADRMLDMGFIEEVESIISFAPKDRQTLLFSATYDDEIVEISKKIQNNPIKIESLSSETPNKIEEIFVKTDNKLEVTKNVICKYKPKNVIIFTNTKIKAQELAQDLQDLKIDALAIHGDLEQYERNDVLMQFSNYSCCVLVATDVAARGLDIKELSMVINYDLANTKETHTHRIGRTARAGESGIAISLCNDYELDELDVTFIDGDEIICENSFEMQPKYITLVIEGGKKDKLRAGDILGALTGDVGVDGKDIGKIDIYDRQAYVAVDKNIADKAFKRLKTTKIKAKKFSVWML